MKYVMSDIHGDYQKYKQMLQKIQFKDEDTLYVLGDVIDRGARGIKILQDMMMRPNVVPILGNHEYMALVALPWLMAEVTKESVKKFDEDVIQGLVEWMNVGGQVTIAEFQRLSQEEREDVLEYLMDFSVYEIVIAGGMEYVLVHAGLDHFSPERDLNEYDVSELIFQKPDYEREYFDDRYLVTGHLPTRVIYAADQGLLLEEISPMQYRDEVFMKNHHIAIDCGSGYGGRLGCLCLDTLEAFYV